jgi:TIR domain
MTHDVFVSHAHKDQRIADAICEKLESIGVSCWLTARDISPGEDWTQVTRNAIESSRLMVLVLSENANAVPHIEREIAHAFYTQRAILPVRLTRTPPPREFILYLGDVCWFDLFGAPVEKRLEALAATIDGIVRGPRDARPSPSVIKTATTLDISNTSTRTLRSSHNRTLKILKSAGIGGIDRKSNRVGDCETLCHRD